MENQYSNRYVAIQLLASTPYVEIKYASLNTNNKPIIKMDFLILVLVLKSSTEKATYTAQIISEINEKIQVVYLCHFAYCRCVKLIQTNPSLNCAVSKKKRNESKCHCWFFKGYDDFNIRYSAGNKTKQLPKNTCFWI